MNELGRYVIPIAVVLVSAIAIPLSIAQLDGVYSDADIRARLGILPVDAARCAAALSEQSAVLVTLAARVLRADCVTHQATVSLHLIDNELTRPCAGPACLSPPRIQEQQALMTRRTYLKGVLAEPSDVQLKPFAANRLNWFWWPLFLLLGCMLVWTAPTSNLSSGGLIGVSFAIYIITSVAHWFRQCESLDEAHVVSFVSARISFISFAYQELEQLALGTLVAIALLRWLNHRASLIESMRTMEAELNRQGIRHLLTKTAPLYADETARWQRASIAVGIFYGATLAFYASNVHDSHDLAYIAMAMVFELVGLVLWATMTYCWYRTWEHWQQCKERLVGSARGPAQLEFTMRQVEAIKPASFGSTLVPAVVAAIGFAMPFIQLAIHG